MADSITQEERLRRYTEELPPDNSKAWKLLESYSKIPHDEVEAHLQATAWKIFPYGCIGRWRFLDLYITTLPVYPEVLERLKSGDTLLDAGCCFGYVLRQLALDGAPQANLIGADLRQEFIDLGYELFRDRDTFGGRFVAGNMLDPADTALTSIDGKVDLIHAASFFHLFNWDDQVRLGERLVRFFKPDAKKALVFGRQVGNRSPRTQQEGGRYRHDPETLQELWDEIGRKTGTRWKATATLHDDFVAHDEQRVLIKFAVYKIE
ncbi:hypothetical protein BR93DRAFT_919711 [Coniochaeta sp. PMI_546]|nr:hypothetical protein BR93DRAFT_919711 [Coniochaeta sp. PMI_546]